MPLCCHTVLSEPGISFGLMLSFNLIIYGHAYTFCNFQVLMMRLKSNIFSMLNGWHTVLLHVLTDPFDILSWILSLQ